MGIISDWHVEEWIEVIATTVALGLIWWACSGWLGALIGVGMLWGLWWLVDAL